MIRIITGFEGSCPHSPRGIRRLGANRFIVYPNYKTRYGQGEEGQGAGFNLFVKLVNPAKTECTVQVQVDWQASPLFSLNDYLYVNGETDPEWRLIPAPMADGCATATFTIAPGETKVGLFPSYTPGDCSKYVAAIRYDPRSEIGAYGKSREGRSLDYIRFRGLVTEGRTNPLVLIAARAHAYETSGNYCVEGLIDFLRGDSEMARYFTAKFDFLILPMLNPDGVANGLSRCTDLDGADMNRVVTRPDKAHRALSSYYARQSPAVFIDFHHWAQRFEYGILTSKPWQGPKIAEYLRPQAARAFKQFRTSCTDDQIRSGCGAIPPADGNWRNYFESKCGTMGVVFEFPWMWNTTAEMRTLGAEALKAALLVWMQDNNA